MKVLDTMTGKGSWLQALNVGAALQVALCRASGSQDAGDPVYPAEVCNQFPDNGYAEVQVQIEGVTGGKIVALYYSDGESLHEPDPRDPEEAWNDGCYFSVADEQPDYVDADIEESVHEAIEEITALPTEKAIDTATAGPGTGLVTTTLPRGASWLLEMATILDSEAAKYREYTPPQQALKSASGNLRSAVGHVLAGGCEVKPATAKVDPF